MDRLAGALGLEIPERAVERVARGAGGHRLLQRRAVEAEGQPVGDGAERGHHACDGLAVARVGHAFAAAAVAAVAQLGDHHLRLGLGAAADREGAGDRPAFGADGQREGAGPCALPKTKRARRSSAPAVVLSVRLRRYSPKRPAAWASMV